MDILFPRPRCPINVGLIILALEHFHAEWLTRVVGSTGRRVCVFVCVYPSVSREVTWPKQTHLSQESLGRVRCAQGQVHKRRVAEESSGSLIP